MTSSSPSPSPSEPVWLTQGRVPSLDGLRAISIGLVLLYHLGLSQGGPTQHSPLPWPLLPLAIWGDEGVTVFFVISGFLITLLLLREWKRTQTVSLSHFYGRRALRILPAYGAFLAGILLLQGLGYVVMSARSWTAALTYTVNFFHDLPWQIRHIWSLSVEEHFYLIWPVLMFCLGPRKSGLIAAGVILITPLVRFLIWTKARDYLDIEICTPSRIDGIAMGCCLAFLANQPGFRRRAQPSGMTAFWISVLILIGISVSRLVLLPSYNSFRYFYPSLTAFGFTILTWLCIIHSGGKIGWILNSRLFIFIGVLSYSLYLWQQPFLQPTGKYWLFQWPVNAGFIAVLALASYFLIERPCLRLRQRWQ